MSLDRFVLLKFQLAPRDPQTTSNQHNLHAPSPESPRAIARFSCDGWHRLLVFRSGVEVPKLRATASFASTERQPERTV